jgi:ketosteroid isomerase-like protein
MKQTKFFKAKTILIIAVVVVTSLAILGGEPAAAQKIKNGDKSDEQILRELVQEENKGARPKLTADTILYSSVVPKPLVGREAVLARSQEISRSRQNEKRERQVKRLVVAKSGDVAYEFGDTVISFDAPDKTRVRFTSSYLRVWRKIGGEWMVDAHFARPNDEENQSGQK